MDINNVFRYILETKYKYGVVLFVLLSLFFWLDPFVFFWRDDWYFISDITSLPYFTRLFEQPGDHVAPFFKLLYFSEFSFFGINTILYQIVSLVLFGLFGYFSSLVYKELSPQKTFFAVSVSVLMLAHSNFSNITLWLFEVCVIAQMLFQACTILVFLRFLKDENQKRFILFIVLLVIQNYFFGNGIFFPLLFISSIIIEKGVLMNRQIIILVVIQILFVLVQKYCSDQTVTILQMLKNLSEILNGFFILISTSITRFFFFKVTVLTVSILSYFLFLIVCFFAFRNDKKKTFFGLVYLIVSSLTISIARAHNLALTVQYYYTVMLIPSLFFILFIAISEINLKYTRLMFFVFLAILLTFLVVDIQVKKVFSYRGFKNKEALLQAIKYSKQSYYPYDEPVLTVGLSPYIDNMRNSSIQNSLRTDSVFEMDTAMMAYFKSPRVSEAFKLKTHKAIENYKILKKRTIIDLNIGYEKLQ